MPNTLAHFAVHVPVTRSLIRGSDGRWVLLGCVLSDVPWTLQRAAWQLLPTLDRYDLRLYAIFQASLFGTLFLAGGLAALSAKPRRTFLVLALGALLHLVMDAFQHKWGNAVHLLAPFSWESARWGSFWPESWPTYALTGLGLAGFLFAVRSGPVLRPAWPSTRRWVVAAALLALYVVLPWIWREAPAGADAHSVATLRDVEERTGKNAWFDRNVYRVEPGRHLLVTFAGEELAVDGVALDHSAVISAHAVFTGPTTIRVLSLHEHRGFRRDWAAYAGLALVLVAWIAPLLRPRPTSPE